MRKSLNLVTLAAAALLATAVPAQADTMITYEVTITNVTAYQRFTPLLLATHQPTVAFFKLGQPSSAQLRTLAEDGDVAPLKGVLDGLAEVTATAAGNALLDPGKSVTFQIKGNPGRDRLSMAAMLIPTNDAFMALDGVRLPTSSGGPVQYTAVSYDAGTEVNDELCASIPGPGFAECGGPGGGAQVGGGEGFVHVSRGMQGIGNFNAAMRDWRNPVAQISVRRLP